MRSLLFACVFWFSLAATARAVSPMAYTRTTLRQASSIVSSARPHNQKLAALSALFRKFLDTNIMGREALGAHWRNFTPRQQKEFLKLFRVLMERSYVAKLLLFDNPKFAYVSQTLLPGGEARVDTKIITPRDKFDVSYRLRPTDDRWVATKITVEEVSLTANLGSQINDLLSRMSVEDLLDLMRRKFGGRN